MPLTSELRRYVESLTESETLNLLTIVLEYLDLALTIKVLKTSVLDDTDRAEIIAQLEEE